jgi:UDPglucose--hexose-1-phosphate uridylyltransferase
MELRKDYVLPRFVYIAANRSKRPYDLIQKEDVTKVKDFSNDKTTCPFCRGNEIMTTCEIGRIPSPDSKDLWDMRWFKNKFPIADLKGNYRINTDNNFFTYSDSFGRHEVLVETSEHDLQMWDFSNERMQKVFKIYLERGNDLKKIEGIKYVLIFKNHGKDAGISLRHSHSQILGINHIPAIVLQKSINNNRFGDCAYCRILNIEKDSLRRVFESENFVSFTPYASRSMFEINIFPKKHVRYLSDLENNFLELSSLLLRILGRLKVLNAPFNINIIESPQSFDLHFHISIEPRFSTWGGVELTGTYVNIMPPEQAAAFYRGEVE